jgi:AcrR family transcriptional regulator
LWEGTIVIVSFLGSAPLALNAIRRSRTNGPPVARSIRHTRSSMPAPRRQRLPRAQREQRMLDAAQEVFATESFAAASMEQIAERSGITKALLYQYFSSKEGLYEATIERARAELYAAMRREIAATPAGEQRLSAFVRGYFDYIEDHRGSWWLLHGDASSPAVNAMRDRNARLVGQLLDEAFAELGRRPADPDTLLVLSQALLGAGEQVGRWWATQPAVGKDDVVARFLRIVGGAIDAAFV